MTPGSSSKPVYIESSAGGIYGIFEPASGAADRPAVLICSPWGWEEIASYRCRRDWARRLAAAGHPTLRFDLPAVGDSAGVPSDPGLVGAWVRAVTDATAWLRSASGRDRVCVIGLGIGGALALAASEEGAAIDELVLWAVPASGKRIVREIEAFSRMQIGGRERSVADLPTGWVEAGGFLLSEETLTDLRKLDPPPIASTRIDRVLLLDRDGIPVPDALREAFKAARAGVSVEPGAGWGEMVFHPEYAVFPRATVELVDAWLERSDGSLIAPPPAAPATLDHLTVEDDDAGTAFESTFSIARPSGEAFAVVSEPADRAGGGPCVVFFNSGAIRHVGPNRLWVEAARWCATHGLTSVRVDLDGIGEADGEWPQDHGLGGFYADVYTEAATAVLDEISRRGLGDEFVAVGLCSGAYLALELAAHDPRVERALLLNAGALIWHTGLRAEREMQWVSGSMKKGSSWQKLLRGEVNLRDKMRILRNAMRWRLGEAYRWLRGLLGGPGKRDYTGEVEDLLDRLNASDRRIVMAFSSNEQVLKELIEIGLIDRLDRWPNIVLEDLSGEDHTLASVAAQRSAHALIERELGGFVSSEMKAAEEIAHASD